MPYKLGKKPARPNAVTFKMAKYINARKLPRPPLEFGHDNLVRDWGMLANDDYGDCVLAGAAHETMLFALAGQRGEVRFTDQAVLADYSAITGFRPEDPDSDQGTDMQMAASYRRHTGIVDANGIRHKIAAYIALERGDFEQLCLATWLFGAVGVGLQLPDYAVDQFDQHRPWTAEHRGEIDGGHYVPVVARRGLIMCVTWGRLQGMTRNFYETYNDESIAYVSEETLIRRTGPDYRTDEGFDLDTLMDDLSAVTRV